MGGAFSSRQNVYVHQYENPNVQPLQKWISVRGVAMPGSDMLIFGERGDITYNPFRDMCVKDGGANQHILITGIHLDMIINDTSHDLIPDYSRVVCGKESKSRCTARGRFR